MSKYAHLFDLNGHSLSKDLNLTKEQTWTTAYHAVIKVLAISTIVLSGVSERPKISDPLIKLFGRRCRYDAVCNRLAEKVVKEVADDVEMVKFLWIMECFSKMLGRDINRARRRIAREPMLTDMGKELMSKAVWHNNFWEAYMDLPVGPAAKKRRNGGLADLLEKAMEKAEKKLRKDTDQKTQEAEKAEVKETEVAKTDGHLQRSDGDKDEDEMKEIKKNDHNTAGEFGEGFEVVVEIGGGWKKKDTLEVNTGAGHEVWLM